jgi:hypothetical protein
VALRTSVTASPLIHVNGIQPLAHGPSPVGVHRVARRAGCNG